MIKFLSIPKNTSAYGYLHAYVTDPLTSIRLEYLIKIKDSFLKEALVLGADTYLPEVNKSLTPNIITLKITPWTFQSLANSKLNTSIF